MYTSHHLSISSINIHPASIKLTIQPNKSAKMKLSIATLLPLLAAASAIPQHQQNLQNQKQNAPFHVMSVSEGPLHNNLVVTSASFFYIGGKSGTDSYCPPAVQAKGDCPPGDTVWKDANTLVSPSYPFSFSVVKRLANKRCDVKLSAVAGDQIIYIDPKGNIRLSGPNGTAMDPGFSTGNFKTTHTPGARYGQWTYDNGTTHGLMACPYNLDNGIYQVMVNSTKAVMPRAGGKIGDCMPFVGGAFEYRMKDNGTAALAGAWVY